MVGSSFSSPAKTKWLVSSLLVMFLFSCKNQSPAQVADSAAPNGTKDTTINDFQRISQIRDTLSRFLDIYLPQQHFSGGILVVKNGQTPL